MVDQLREGIDNRRRAICAGWRRVALFYVAAAAAGLVGCAPAPPPVNPILENHQAKLRSAESHLRSRPEPAHGDYLQVGKARMLVWEIHQSRSEHRGTTHEARSRAAEYRRQADRLLPKVIDAFARAMDRPPDPLVAAEAKMWMVRLHGRRHDWNEQMQMLWRILREHGDLNAPHLFGLAGTPQYYCHYTLAEASRRTGNHAGLVINAAHALAAADAGVKAGRKDAARARDALLGQLLHDDPRVVLPAYQALLPDGAAWILRAHRDTAATRVALTVEHVDTNGLIVRYDVHFPGHSDVLKAWMERQKMSPVHLPDDFSGRKPTFRLSFAALSAEKSYRLFEVQPPVLTGVTHTSALVFDDNGRATGKMILKWSDKAPYRTHIYLAARLKQSALTGRVWPPAGRPNEVFTEPVEVLVEQRR